VKLTGIPGSSGLRRHTHNSRLILPAELEKARRATVESKRKRDLMKEQLSRLQKSGASSSAKGQGKIASVAVLANERVITTPS